MTEQVAMNGMMKEYLGAVITGVPYIVADTLYNNQLGTTILVLVVIGVIFDFMDNIDTSTLLRRRVGSIESIMPPKKKKTKSNEKCPCGSGEKHKRCCMVAGKRASSMVAAASSAHPPTTNPVLDETVAALSLSTTTTTITTTVAAAASNSMVPCFHGSGSTSNRFSDGRAYRDVIQEFLAVPKEKGWRVTFEQDHKE